jgi:hypothetical protein
MPFRVVKDMLLLNMAATGLWRRLAKGNSTTVR